MPVAGILRGGKFASAVLLPNSLRAAAEAFAAADPYASAGLFESSVIRPFRQVYKDGARVA